MNPFICRLIAIGFSLVSLCAVAQVDRWDDLMEHSATAWQEGDMARARKLVTEAVYEGKYDTVDRFVSSLVLQAGIEQDAGNLESAEDALRKAIEIIDRVPGPLQEDKAVLHNNLGVLLDLTSDLPGAEQQYRAAMALHKTLAAARTEDRFSLVMNFAGLMERRGDIKSAYALFTEAESLLPILPLSATATLNNNWAAMLQRQGDSGVAIRRLQQALVALPVSAGTQLLRATILHNLGTAELETGAHVSALEHLLHAETIRRTQLGDKHPDTARTLISLALLMERQQLFGRGLALAREASSVIAEMLANRAGTRAANANTLERKEWRESFSTHLRLLSLAEPDPQRQANEALNLMQAMKHGELARVFASASIGNDGEIGRRTSEIRLQANRFLAKDRQLTQAIQTGQTSGTKEARLRQELADARKALANMQDELSLTFPKYFELVAGRVTPLEAIQASLRVDEGVLFYLVGSSESFGVAITRTTASFFQSGLGKAELSRLVMRIRQTVDPNRVDSFDQFAFDEAQRIYRELVVPAGSALADKKIWFVIPDGALESLPFSLLLESSPPPDMRKDFSKAPWVLRNHATVTLPSLGALTLARSAPPTVPAPELLIAFADPVIGEFGDRPGQRRSLTAQELWSASVSGRRLADPDFIRRLARLPESADEARSIAAALGGGELFLGAQANERALKGLDLFKFRNLLFATHGAMASDFVDLGEPGLILTPPTSASEIDDGLLTASEIAQLKLNADLVVLSACNTAAPDGTPGAEGFSGLTKSFFHAGARNLLVSHWAVDSESTVKITTGLFEQFKHQPDLGRSRALQASMMKLLDGGPAFSHPMYWAPFVMVGGEP